MILIKNCPYVHVHLDNGQGLFIIDFGTNGSSIDVQGFDRDVMPHAKKDSLINGEHFLTFQKFDLDVGDAAFYVRPTTAAMPDGMKQTGIVGTDFLSDYVYTLDYMNQWIYKSVKPLFVKDSILLAAGFKPASSKGYYANDLSQLHPNTVNCPVVPVKIGSVSAEALVDPGFDDFVHYHSININQAFYNALIKANIQLVPMNEKPESLSTCDSAVRELVTGYTLAPGTTFSIICKDGRSILISSDVHIMVKETPDAAKGCFGIGSWGVPGAQIGASFLKEAKIVIFDPFSSTVWFYNP